MEVCSETGIKANLMPFTAMTKQNMEETNKHNNILTKITSQWSDC